MQISVESHGDTAQVHLQGEANIYHVAELKEKLHLALLAYSVIELDMEDVIEVDTTVLQLLASFFISVANEGKEVRITRAGAAFADVAGFCNLLPAFGLK